MVSKAGGLAFLLMKILKGMHCLLHTAPSVSYLLVGSYRFEAEYLSSGATDVEQQQRQQQLAQTQQVQANEKLNQNLFCKQVCKDY